MAELLGVSAARVRQMVEEGKLPNPVTLGPRTHIWHRRDVEAYRASVEGKRTTRLSVLLAPASPPLQRTHDFFVDYGMGPISYPSRAHVRIWQGPAEEGYRQAVLIGALSDHPDGTSNFVEDLVSLVDTGLLGGSGQNAVWFHYRPEALGGLHEVACIVFEVAKGFGQRWRRFFGGGMPSKESHPQLINPSWRLVSVAEVERVVGASLECYPKPSYTEATVTLWQRTRQPVPVVHDEVGLRPILTALAELDSTGTASAGRQQTAREACHLLAAAARERIDYLKQPWAQWDDGRQRPSFYDRRRAWPGHFAAYLIPPESATPDQERLARYLGSGFEALEAGDTQKWIQLLQDLRSWVEEVDELADTPQLALCEALKTAESTVSAQIRQADPTISERDYPEVAPYHPSEVIGNHDRKYVASLAWQEKPRIARRHRALMKQFLEERRERLRFGTDRSGHLVAYDPGAEGWDEVFAAEWPLRPPKRGLEEGAKIVGDGAIGDRPVYIEYADGELELLPRSRNPIAAGGWNWGYSGGGPGALAAAIARTIKLAYGLDDSQVPGEWIDDFIEHADSDHMNLRVVDILRRIRD